MKKAIKLIISAASAMSMVGVGAASFANWQSDTELDADLAAGGVGLGHITASIIGFTGTVEDKTLTDNLVPYNQVDEYEGVKFISIQLPEHQATAAYNVTVTVNGPALEGTGAFYAQYGSAISEAPASLDTAWTKIGGTGAVLAGAYDEDGDQSQLFTGKCVNIVLDSSSLKDMDKSGYSFTIELVEAE